MTKRIITISREFGSGGRFIGEEVAKKLGIAYYDKNIINEIAEKSGLSPEYVFEIFSQKISTHLLIMEVDFCPVLCILEAPVLQAFRGISHFVWYCKAVSDLS